ncbi:hypothetical protein B7R56_20430 [Pseudomonas savastanoi pv. retacarpa]|uniref:Uncharacterized protein n=2 Tax=Pseudomonas syringae group genomosp. 2 TaxID=251698 RepID=A0A0P9VXZ1_9PSED|nr:hypothetical protein ALO64_100832 [Pseudomonas meliae]KPX96082.1 hypothetical protein ALO62_103487 [Pseudomonas amygdali pv. myricae]KPY01711.1 hypothetical protein ALO61_102781 [Pseudomonas savastanoi pv. nerii]KPY76431.1 hypothetical protein ALO58_102866 [Pseudomonas savastanoi pv. savastanoi]KUG44363.1 hypothetical protein ALP79_102891 [Pseudomonas savastanoi pv. fraxini]OSR26599.1 hypothetical protein B7R56_20430 [Pseudomonas savastanoi pv. retacarpa]PPS33723.1 hypothetical protein BVY
MLQKPMIAGAAGGGEAAMPEKRQGISAVGGESGKRGAVFLPVSTCRLTMAALHHCLIRTPNKKETRRSL